MTRPRITNTEVTSLHLGSQIRWHSCIAYNRFYLILADICRSTLNQHWGLCRNGTCQLLDDDHTFLLNHLSYIVCLHTSTQSIRITGKDGCVMLITNCYGWLYTNVVIRCIDRRNIPSTVSTRSSYIAHRLA